MKKLTPWAVSAVALLLMHCQSSGTGAAPLASPSLDDGAQPQVELLTSLETPAGWSRAGASSLPEALEQDFRQGFANAGLKLVVKHSASAADLHDALMDHHNLAVYWVSHAGSDQSESAGLEIDGIVADINGADVKDVFQQIQPGLRYLAIVGCSAKTIIDGFKTNGDYALNTGLTIDDFAQPVDAETGLKQSIAQFMNTKLTPAPALGCPSQLGLEIQIDYQLDLPEVQIELNGQFLTVLRNTANHATIYIPKSLLAPGTELNLIVNSGLDPQSAPAVLGTFKFSSASLDSSDWSLFADASGAPIGAGEELYRYTGDLNSIRYVNDSVFSCP
jgi:hypothetical protein